MDEKRVFEQRLAHLNTKWLMCDSHMHIQSSHTTPLPLLWGANPVLEKIKLGRRTIDNLSVFIAGGQAGGAYSGYLIFSEELIGRVVVEKNFLTYHEDSPFVENEEMFKSVFSPMIVMPMDMEYAHISGYPPCEDNPQLCSDTIYHTDGKVWYYYIRENAFHAEVEGVKRKVKRENDKQRDNEKKEISTKKFYEKYVTKPKVVSRRYSPRKRRVVTKKEYRYIDDRLKLDNGVIKAERAEMFVGWEKQIDRTKQAAYHNPFHLIPMYHYEPRRWMKKEASWEEPFADVATKKNKGIFIGMKMYPPLGYKPNDFERMPELIKYYARCERDEIPILAHCSPGGMVTHDADLYMDLDGYGDIAHLFTNIAKSKRKEFREDYECLEEARNSILKKKKYHYSPEDNEALIRYEKYMDRMLRTEKNCYFANKYVSPLAWVQVLRKFKKLKICMAHFGGDEWCKPFFGDKKAYGQGGSDWIDKIIDIIHYYENAYTDISCFFLKNKIKLWHRHDGFKRCKDVFGGFLKKNLGNDKLLSKILLGTDWYLIKITNKGYGKDEDDYEGWINLMKEFLDDIHPSLWIRFSMINPCKFYGLDDPKKIENMAAILLKKAPKDRIKTEVQERKHYFLSLVKEGSDSARGNLSWLEEYVKK